MDIESRLLLVSAVRDSALEQTVLDEVLSNGKSDRCKAGCPIAVGRKCPPQWCEVLYIRANKDKNQETRQQEIWEKEVRYTKTAKNYLKEIGWK